MCICISNHLLYARLSKSNTFSLLSLYPHSHCRRSIIVATNLQKIGFDTTVHYTTFRLRYQYHLSLRYTRSSYPQNEYWYWYWVSMIRCTLGILLPSRHPSLADVDVHDDSWPTDRPRIWNMFVLFLYVHHNPQSASDRSFIQTDKRYVFAFVLYTCSIYYLLTISLLFSNLSFYKSEVTLYRDTTTTTI